MSQSTRMSTRSRTAAAGSRSRSSSAAQDQLNHPIPPHKRRSRLGRFLYFLSTETSFVMLEPAEQLLTLLVVLTIISISIYTTVIFFPPWLRHVQYLFGLADEDTVQPQPLTADLGL